MKKLLTLLSLTICIGAAAQQYGFIQYSVSEGLAQSQVNCLYQDSYGYIWVGTLGGLSRFDGREFTNYSQRDGLPGNQIRHISEDDEGRLILGLVGSMAILERGTIKGFPLPDGMRQNQVIDVCVKGDSIWVATSGGLLLFENDRLTRLNIDHPCYAANIKRLVPTEKGWIVCTRSEVFEMIDGDVNPIYSAQDGQPFFDLELDENGDMWIAALGSGLVQISSGGQAVKTFGIEHGLVSSTLTDIQSDRQGGWWLSSEHGISHWTSDGVTSFSALNGMPNASANVTLLDQEGVLWIGTAGGGLIKYAGDAFISYTSDHGLCGNGVLGLITDTTGTLWLASYEGGICSLNGAYQFEDASFYSSATTSNQFWCATVDAFGNKWFGSSTGLMRVSGDEVRWFTRDDGLNHRKVLSLLADESGDVWIGTSRGLNLWSAEKQQIDNFKKVPQHRIRKILREGNVMWLASNKGVIRSEVISSIIAEEEGLTSNSTSCVEIGPQGRIWVGTDNGLNIIDGDSIITPILDASFGSNSVNFLEYVSPYMYIGTNSGLFVCEPSGNLDKWRFANYTLHDGLVSLETNLNAGLYDERGFFWFGTAEGLVRANLSGLRMKESTPAPRLIIEDVRVNFETQNWPSKGLETDIRNGLPQDIRLKHHSNNVEFYFTGISTTDPDEVKYEYMLEGYDRNWQPASDVDFAYYRNLPYEDFSFRVRAINGEGKASAEQMVTLAITPPFWLQGWFLALAALVGAGIVVLIFRRRQQMLRTKLDKERYEYKSKMLALEQQSLNSSMNRHFIFNALNSIQYYINRKDRIAANKYLSAFAKLIRKNLDSSQTNVTSLREEIERLELYLQLEHMRFRDKFDYRIEVQEGIDQDSVKVPAMLLQPFLENSIWHGILPSEKPGRIIVDISRDKDNIVFCVKDNGVGIDTSMKKKRVDETHISKGMSITSGRIDLLKKTASEAIELHGPYEIRDDQDAVEGTEVRIILPHDFHEIYPN